MASVQLQENNNIPITKIYICPVDNSWDPFIRQYFSQFGEVESIAYHSKDDFGYAFVQFDSDQSATKAMAKHRHNIGGKTVKTKAAHNHHQNQTRFKVPEADSPSNILNKLNEHCLMEIFEYLSVPDLCSIGNVCNDFRAVAKKVFSIQSPIVNSLSIRNLSLFRLFGPEIKTIDISFNTMNEAYDNRVLDLLATYCSAPTCALNKIIIWDWQIKGEFMERLISIFSRIQVLHIFGAVNGTVSQILGHCNELNDLRLRSVDFGGISKIVLPKLESLHMEETPGLNDYMINRFLKSHPQLKKLTIDSWTGKLTPKALRNLSLNLTEFQLFGDIKISTAYVDSMLNHLKRLKNMKSFGFSCFSVSPDEVLNVLIDEGLPIEELYLTDFKFDSNFLNAIKSFKYLKMIKLRDGEWEDENLLIEMVKAHPQLESIVLNRFGDVNVSQIKELVKLAPKLKYMKLDVKFYEQIDSDDFTSILNSIKSRPDKTKLKIRLNSHGFAFNVLEIMKKKSSEWLEIEIDDGAWSIRSDTDSDGFSWSDEYDDYYDSDDIYDQLYLF